jgi:hypothetical protein
MVEFSPVELAWLEILVGFYPVDGLAQFVEITNGVAVPSESRNRCIASAIIPSSSIGS